MLPVQALLLIAILPLAGRRFCPPPLFHALSVGLFQTAGFPGFMMWALGWLLWVGSLHHLPTRVAEQAGWPGNVAC